MKYVSITSTRKSIHSPMYPCWCGTTYLMRLSTEHFQNLEWDHWYIYFSSETPQIGLITFPIHHQYSVIIWPKGRSTVWRCALKRGELWTGTDRVMVKRASKIYWGPPHDTQAVGVSLGPIGLLFSTTVIHTHWPTYISDSGHSSAHRLPLLIKGSWW